MTAAADLSARLAGRCAADGEFLLAARYWTGSLCFVLGNEVVALSIDDGRPTAGDATTEPVSNGSVGAGTIVVRGATEVWDQVLAQVPPPFFNDIMPAQAFGLRQQSEPETFWQYFPAVRRAVDLLRLDRNGS